MLHRTAEKPVTRHRRTPSLVSIYIGASSILVLLSLLIYIPIQYAYTYRIISEYVAEIDSNSLQQLNDRFSTGVAEMEQYLTNLEQNATLKPLLQKAEDNRDNSYIARQSIQDVNDYLVRAKNAYDDIYCIDVVTMTRVYSSSNNEAVFGIANYSSYTEINRPAIRTILAESSNGIGFLTPDIMDGFTNRVSRFIYMLSSESNSPVYLVFQMKSEWVDGLLKTNKGSTGLFQIGSHQIAFASDAPIIRIQDSIDQTLTPTDGSAFINSDGQHYNLSWQTMDKYGFVFVFLQNLTDLLKPLDRMRRYAVVAVILSLLSSAVFIWIFTRRAVSDLNKLQLQAKNYTSSGVGQLLPLKYRARSLHEETSFSLFLIMSLPLVIFSLLFNFLSVQIIDNTKEDLILLSLDKQIENVESFIKWNRTVTERIMFDDTIQDIIKEVNTGSDYDRLQLEHAISDNIMISTPLVIDFYDVNGRHFFTSQLNTQIAAPEIGEPDKVSYGEMLFVQPEISTQGIRQLRFTRKIKNIQITKQMSLQTIGYISCYYHESILSDIVGQPLMGNIYLCDHAMNVIYSDAKETNDGLTGAEIAAAYLKQGENQTTVPATFSAQDAQGSHYMIFARQFAMNDWVVFSVIPDSEFNKDHTLLFFFNATMVLLFCCLAFFVSRLLSANTVKPIIQLIESILQSDVPQADSECEKQKSDHQIFFPNELNELTYAFNKMTTQIKRVYDLEAEKNKAELQALQAQINPHFMYNTFESIRWMNKMGDRDSIDQMIGNLSDLFRLGISDEKKMIRLEEEVSYANAYLSIQKMRYGDQLSFAWDIDTLTTDIWIPKLILQPLIENAIYHGVRELEDTPGKILISSRLQSERLILEISDNGPGMTEDMQRQLTDQLANPSSGGSLGIGMSNVCRRLSFYYQDQFNITITSQPFVKTSIVLDLPVSIVLRQKRLV